MGEVIRFGVSIDEKLLRRFNKLISHKGYTNRSEAIRDLIREHLVEEEWDKEDKETVGTINLVYNHETRELADTLIDLQHHYCSEIISTMHIHLDEHNCLEVLIVKGKAKKIREIADKLISTKGVKYGRLTAATSGKELT